VGKLRSSGKLIVAEARFRRPDALERMRYIYLGVQFQARVEVRQQAVQELAA